MFESVIHNCVLIDGANPHRPILEVDALLRPGDADEGPLLLPAPQFMALCGGPDAADGPMRSLRDAGRLETRQGITHISFPFWEPVAD